MEDIIREEIDQERVFCDLMCDELTLSFTVDRDQVLQRLQSDLKLPLWTNDSWEEETIYFRDFYYTTRRTAILVHNRANQGASPSSFACVESLDSHLHQLGFQVITLRDISDFDAVLTLLSPPRDRLLLFFYFGHGSIVGAEQLLPKSEKY